MTEQKHLWFSQQGGSRKVLSDYCAIGKLSNTTIFVLTDGATSGPNGDVLARELAKNIIGEIASLETKGDEVDVQKVLGSIHLSMRENHKNDIASYLIVLAPDQEPLQIYYAGDCRFGVVDRSFHIRWITDPHCLANATYSISEADLQKSKQRHTLTRSFNYKRIGPPQTLKYVPSQDELIILATDGFWGELGEDQARILIESADRTLVAPNDDCSFLVLSTKTDLAEFDKADLLICSDNIYV